MTVEELIEKLKGYPKDATVWVLEEFENDWYTTTEFVTPTEDHFDILNTPRGKKVEIGLK